MCLKIVEGSSLTFDSNRSVICYKVYEVVIDRLWSVYMHAPIYSAGVVLSDRSSTEITSEEQSSLEVNNGIHVYLEEKDCHGGLMQFYRVVPVQCKLEDLVAIGEFDGTKSAVFTKVEITKEEWNKAVNG